MNPAEEFTPTSAMSLQQASDAIRQLQLQVQRLEERQMVYQAVPIYDEKTLPKRTLPPGREEDEGWINWNGGKWQGDPEPPPRSWWQRLIGGV